MRKITGTDNRPRLAVFRSNRHIYAQIINDMAGIVITGASTLSASIRESKKSGPKEKAREVGKLIAGKAAEKKISKVAFDRNGYKYHGKVKELADGAREGGLEF